LEDRTLFRQISVLPAGSCWRYSPHEGFLKGIYFDQRKWEEQVPLEPEEYYYNLKNAWHRALSDYLRRPVALSLTGGVDSRMVLAGAQVKSGELPCYTFGGKYRDSQDVVLARELAGIAGQSHTVLSIGDEFLRDFARLAEQAVWISDGGMDITGTIDLYVGRKARQIAPARITGTCGGEILRRLVAFKPIAVENGLFQPELAACIKGAGATYTKERSGHPVSFTAFKQTSWHLAPKFALERSQLILRMPFYDNRIVALSYCAPEALATSNKPALRLIAESNPALAKSGTDRGAGTKSLPIVRGLRRAFQEGIFKTEYYFDYGMPNWLSKVNRVLAPFQIERQVLGRHKFHHFRVFYRDQLADFVQDALLGAGARSSKYVLPGRLRQIVRGHACGSANYTWELHKLLTVEMIERTLLSLN
jgi:asparagine synthase (glutamine-hydrolysing)